MGNKSGVFIELVEQSTERVSTTSTLFLTILEEEVADS